MKKITIMMAACAAVLLTSCKKTNVPQVQLKSDVDSASYAMGEREADGIRQSFFAQEMNGMKNPNAIDSAYVEEFVKGIMDAGSCTPKQKAYYAGISIGYQMSAQLKDYLRSMLYGPTADSTCQINEKNFYAGLIDAINKKPSKLGAGDLNVKLEVMSKRLRDAQSEKAYGAYKKQNADFMARIAKTPGMQKLGKGVYYKVLTEGKGEIPKESDQIKINYEGKTIDGNVFDSSFDRNEPVQFGVNQVIPGFTEALTHMPVGSTWEVYIPSEAAYGEQAGGPIKPYSTLIFKIQLIEIIK